MESPILSPDIIALGRKLNSEFSKNERTTPTTKWITQYLAELMFRIEKSNDDEQKRIAEKEAFEIILKLWHNKDAIPNAIRPLGNLKDALDVLDALKADDPETPYWQKTRNVESYSPWGKFIAQSRQDSQMIFQITACLVLGGDILKKEKEWSEFPGLLTSEESKIIEDLDWLVSEYSAAALHGIRIKIGDFDMPEPPTDRLTKAFDKIEQLLQEQIKSVSALRARMLENSDE
jgi:hypothetical protein